MRKISRIKPSGKILVPILFGIVAGAVAAVILTWLEPVSEELFSTTPSPVEAVALTVATSPSDGDIELVVDPPIAKDGHTTYPRDSVVTITALPKPGWELVSWDGVDRSKGNIAWVTLDEDRSVEVFLRKSLEPSFWHLDRTTLLDKFSDEITLSWNNRAYTIGCLGQDCTSFAVVAELTDTGFTEVRPVPAPNLPRTDFGGAIWNGNLYVVGGDINGQAPTTSVEFAQIDPFSGNLTEWRETAPLPKALSETTVVGNQGFLYAAGGLTELDGPSQQVTFYSQIEEDGSLGPWREGAWLNNPRAGGAMASVGSYLFILGGLDNDPNNVGDRFLSSIERAKIREDGSIEPWEHAGFMAASRYWPSVASSGSTLLVVGGQSCNVCLTQSSEFIKVGPDGELISFGLLPELSMPIARASSNIIGSKLYTFGGVTLQGHSDIVWTADISQYLQSPP